MQKSSAIKSVIGNRQSAICCGSSGVTLIELLVVLSLIFIIAGIAVSSVSGFASPKERLRREARGMMKLFAEARRTAMVRKVKVGVYVDESARAVFAIESAGVRHLRQTGEFYERLLDVAEAGLNTNRFFRGVYFSEEVVPEAFSVDEIARDGDEVDIFQPEVFFGEAAVGEVLAFSFTHFGGASGGGVSLTRDGIRLDLACDILTGRVAPVTRRGVEE